MSAGPRCVRIFLPGNARIPRVCLRGGGEAGPMCMESERGTHNHLSLSPANAERWNIHQSGCLPRWRGPAHPLYFVITLPDPSYHLKPASPTASPPSSPSSATLRPADPTIVIVNIVVVSILFRPRALLYPFIYQSFHFQSTLFRHLLQPGDALISAPTARKRILEVNCVNDVWHDCLSTFSLVPRISVFYNI